MPCHVWDFCLPILLFNLRLSVIASTLTVGSLVVPLRHVWAESDANDLVELPTPAAVHSDTTALAEELAELRKRIESFDKADERSPETPSPLGDRIDVSNEKWTVKLGGHVQMDYVTWADADSAIVDAENYFSYRRLRLVADGTGYGQFDFRLQMTLEPGSGSTEDQFASPDVKDAYLSMNETPLGRIRIGNFFVPFSLEQVTNDTNNIFNERSIPTQGIFAADREVGVALYNCTADESLTWTGGFFFDDLSDTIKTRLDNNQGYRIVSRLTCLPYYHEPSNGRYMIHAGVGLLHTDDFDDTVRFRARPQVQRGPILIDTGNLVADSYTTANVELAVVWGPVTVQGEAFLSHVNRIIDPDAQVSGAYVHGSYFLTGENRIFERFGQHGAQFGRNVPNNNFFWVPGGCGPGAWELKARWSNLGLTQVAAGIYNDLTCGFNWYWSDRTRIMFDWIHPITTGEAVFGNTTSDLIAMRFDFNW
jgi:phosphate-selective porin OprO and OprP